MYKNNYKFFYFFTLFFYFHVRCLIPDDQVNKITSMDLHPTLHAWFRISDVNLFADNILLKDI